MSKDIKDLQEEISDKDAEGAEAQGKKKVSGCEKEPAVEKKMRALSVIEEIRSIQSPVQKMFVINQMISIRDFVYSRVNDGTVTQDLYRDVSRKISKIDSVIVKEFSNLDVFSEGVGTERVQNNVGKKIVNKPAAKQPVKKKGPKTGFDIDEKFKSNSPARKIPGSKGSRGIDPSEIDFSDAELDRIAQMNSRMKG